MRFLPSQAASFRLGGDLFPLRAETDSSETVREIRGLTVKLTHTWYTDSLVEFRVDIANTSASRSAQITKLILILSRIR